jgi:hypothetical protein
MKLSGGRRNKRERQNVETKFTGEISSGIRIETSSGSENSI